jgi:hypothetical protein
MDPGEMLIWLGRQHECGPELQVVSDRERGLTRSLLSLLSLPSRKTTGQCRISGFASEMQ